MMKPTNWGCFLSHQNAAQRNMSGSTHILIDLGQFPKDGVGVTLSHQKLGHVMSLVKPCHACHVPMFTSFTTHLRCFFLIVFLISIKTSNVSIIFQTHLTIVCPTMFISKDIFMAFSNVFHICSYGSWIFSTCFPYVPGLRCWVQPRTGPPLGSINSCGTVKHGMACWKMPRL
jgi:hypothetical protein